MEVHMSRVASFATPADITPMHTGSARRRSYTLDSSCRAIHSDIVGKRGNSQTRPYSHKEPSSTVKSALLKESSPKESNLNFGVIPQELHSRLLDMKDYKSRTHAVEELKLLIQHSDFRAISHSNVVSLINFLCTLLDDKNFTVVLVTLDVLNYLVFNLGHGVNDFLQPVIASTVKLLGDSKIAVKQEYMKVYMRLMKVVGPQKILKILLDHLKHKNSRVREEVVNICIISLLTYPSEDFNLAYLACEIAPCLIDSKRKVRHAALEAFAVLAATMGPGKCNLFKAVDEVELQENGEGLMNAVQARLARKSLPRITSQGLVEYALPFPSSARHRATPHLPGADTDWLLTGTRILSGQYTSGDSSGRSAVPHIDPVLRRMLSAGKGKNRFPWENQHPGGSNIFSGNQPSVVMEPDQPSSQFDTRHTPIVKTPTAKTRNSSSKTLSSSNINKELPSTVPANNGSTVPVKATLVRVPSARKDLNRSRPVPPITKGATSLPDISNVISSTAKNGSQETENINEDESIGIDLLDLHTKDDDDRDEMLSSLRHLRNSAAKKRAKISGSLSDLDSPDSMKMDLNMDSPTLTSSPISGTYSESGVYSQESWTSPVSPTPQLKKTSDAAKSKSRPPRLPSPRSKDGYKKGDSLHQGVSVNEKQVRIIGQRLNYKSGVVDGEEDLLKDILSGPMKILTKDVQKTLKPMKGIMASTNNFQQVSAFHCDLTEDSVAIIGKGVFETPPPPYQSHSQSSFSTNDDLTPTKQDIQPPAGIYGRAVQQNSPAVESEVKVTISKSAREKMRQRRENSLKELESKDPEKREQIPRQRLSQTEPNWVFMESRKPASDSLESFEISPPSLKRTSSLKRTTAAQGSPYKERKSSISRTSEVINPFGLSELPRPENSVAEAFRLLADDDWEKKIEGLGLVRSLTVFHSDLLTERLHDLKIAVIQEVKNLRSGVSRAAIVCLGDMFSSLKKNMDHELDNCVRVLLHKSGDSNVFIREDVDKTLHAMVQNVTPARALASLINGGLSHLNNAVRKCAAQHMSDLVEKMGPGRILSGVRDITDKALAAIAKFAQDGSQETRFFGRKMLHFLMSHPDFDRMLEKYIPDRDLSYIKDLMKNIQQKGVGEIQDTTSARGRRSYHGSVSSLRASSMSQNVNISPESGTCKDAKPS